MEPYETPPDGRDARKRPNGRNGTKRPVTAVRPEILASWQRSHCLGIDQEGAELPIEVGLNPDSRLLRAAAPVLDRLGRRMSGLPTTLVLTDARANIVDRRGDPAGLRLMDAASLVLGANVDERFMGTSSVSMVLSTREPFMVVGQEHFLFNLKELTCMAAPVRDPVSGTVQGAVNLSVPHALSDPAMALELQDATARIGERLLHLSTARERELLRSFSRARKYGGPAALHLGSGELVRPDAPTPRLTSQERLVLLERAVELISSPGPAFAEVPLSGGRVALLRRREMHHGEADGVAVEVGFLHDLGPGARGAAAGAVALGGRQVPRLDRTAAGAGTGPDAAAPGRQPGPAGAEDAEGVEPGPDAPTERHAARTRGGTEQYRAAHPAAPDQRGTAADPSGVRCADPSGTDRTTPTGTDPADPSETDCADPAEAWLLLVGEPGVGRLAAEARGRLSLLNEAGTRLGTTLDMRRTAEELAKIAVPRFADLVVVDLADSVLAGEEAPSGRLSAVPALRRVVVWTGEDGPGPSAAGLDAPVTYSAGTPQARCMESRQPVMDSLLTAAFSGPPAKSTHPIALLGEGEHSYLGAPLSTRGRLVGLVGFYRRGRDRPYEQDDLALAGELAARAAIGVDNARHYRREHHASLTLQRSLLPRALPRLPAVELSSRYLPADTSAGVGGDWFDAIPLSGMRVALVVGDVPGNGLEAAATMGRLRTAVRTLAGQDLLPEEVLAHLDDLISHASDEPDDDPASDHQDPATGATCLYAVYDPVTRRCTAARAGHPPPAVAEPGGAARLIELPAGPPLGLGGLLPYESATVELPEGGVLALYTDGLLKEGRGYEDTGGRTADLLAALDQPGAVLDDVCDRISRTLLPEGPRDDAALLLARVHALAGDRVASWEFPSDPSVVARARALAADQLAAWGVPDGDTTGLVVSELVTNAVRYGGQGPIGLRLLRGDASLICEVSDSSNTSPRIRRAATTEEGGRGLFLVAQFTKSWGARYMPRGKTVWAEQLPQRRNSAAEPDEETLLAMFDDDPI
ncbi:SpoIIE family protein phosphatase [Streptomyces sp. NPDC047017]|uniref:SpoIIE family protein phosphatase n=1 Tax=Streptomyces sp. NPDC047017 TaxID=3155024 RepID=UPI0033D37588